MYAANHQKYVRKKHNFKNPLKMEELIKTQTKLFQYCR